MNITIPGIPKPQKRHKFGRGFVYDPSKKDKKEFSLLAKEFAPKQPLEGDIIVQVWFYMPRPKNHCRTGKFSGILKDGAPTWHSKRPDIDNLLKFVMDALQIGEIFYKDDANICFVQAGKQYATEPRTEITLEEI